MRTPFAVPGTKTCASVSKNVTDTISFRKNFNRALLSLLAVIAVAGAAQAQSAANYTFATATTGSLAVDKNGNAVDLSAISSTFTTSNDDNPSAVNAIGFDFFFMGNRYSQFSFSTNAMIQMGSTAVGNTVYTVSGGSVASPKFSPYGADLGVSTTGTVKYKVVGAAPNRCLVLEYNNMTIFWTTAYTSDGSFQARFYEDGTIEYVYGTMTVTSIAATSRFPSIGFSAGSAANTFAYVTVASNTNTTTGSFTDNPAPTTGPIASLNSAANGSRRFYKWTPATPVSGPSALTFSSVGPLGLTLNWTAASPTTNSVSYQVYSSTDGITYNYSGSSPVGTNSYSLTNLSPATNYFFKVYSVSEGALSSTIASGSTSTTATASSYTSTASGGLWSQGATWVGGNVPGAGDNAIIADGATVTIDVSPTVTNLTVGQGVSGILAYTATAAQTLTVIGDVVVSTGGSFRAAVTGSTSTITTHAISIAGSFTSSGNVDFSSRAGAAGNVVNASKVNITFTGTNNASFNLSSATLSNLAAVTLNKGTSATPTLTFSGPANAMTTATNSSAATVNVASTAGMAVGMYVSVISGTGAFSAGTTITVINSPTQFTTSAAASTTLTSTAVVLASTIASASAPGTGFLTITNGTFEVAGSNVNYLPYFATAGYTIPATGGFTVNNANSTVTGQNSSPTLNGKLNMTAGTYNVGNSTGNAMGAAATAIFNMNGGTVNFAGRFNTANALTFNMTGGTINVTTVGNTSSATPGFGMTSTTASVTISGGTINLVQASTGATQSDYSVLATTPSISGGTLNIGTPGVTATKFSFVVNGSVPTLVVNSTMTLNMLGNTVIERGASVTNNGTITGTTSGCRLSFISTSAQAFNGSGTITSPLDGIIVRNAGGLTINHTTGFNTLNVLLQQGTITNSNKITIGTGAAAAASVQTGFTASAVAGGAFDVAPNFNLGTGTYTISALQESVARVLNLEIPGSRAIGALVINNTNGVSFSGGNLASGILTLTAGNLTTSSSSLLTVTGTTTGSVSGGSATSYVNGPLARTLPASLVTGSTYSFPIGKSGLNAFELVNALTNAGGTVAIQAEVFDADAGGTAGPAFSVLSTSRYWQVQTNSGAGNFTSSLLRLNDTRGSFNGIGKSATQGGAYNLVGSGSPTLTTTSITTAAPAVTSLTGFYLMGTLAPPSLTNLSISPTGVNCTTSVQRVVTVDVSGGVGPYTLTLSYQVNGGTATNVSMSNSGGSTYTGTIPTVTPSNGTVTWTVTVTDANTLTSSLTGTSYQDAPLVGVVPVITASSSTVCDGTSVTLTATVATPAVNVVAETMETFPQSTFTVAGTSATFVQNSTFQSQGSNSGVFKTTAFSTTVTLASSSNINLSGYNTPKLIFSHIAALETVDPGYLDYSIDGGTNWIQFPTSSYTGTAVMAGTGGIGFNKASYTNWNTALTSSASVPTNALWQTETINIPAAALNSTQFRVRFRIVADGSVTYFGWMIDNFKVTGSPALPSYTWTPGGITTSVPTLVVTPSSTTNYNVVGSDANGCFTDVSAAKTITVNPLPSAPNGTPSLQCGTAVPTASVSSTSGLPTPSFKWYDASSGGNLLQTSTSTTYTSSVSTTTFFYVSELNTVTGCESGRVQVTVLVQASDPITASVDDNSVCPGTPISLSATQTGSNQNFTYSWTAAPAAGSGIPSGSVPGNPAAVTPTAAGTYVYTVTGIDGSCQSTNTVSVTVTAPPAVSASGPASVCPSSPVALSATSTGIGAGTVTIGTGTSTNTTTSNLGAAYPTYYGNGRQQYLVLASELTAAGLRTGNITSLAFDVATLGTGVNAHLDGYTLKISSTNASNITTFQTGTFTTVLGPVNYTPVLGINTHTFTTPFNWDGSSNLIIEMCFSNSVTGQIADQTITKYTTTAFNSQVYYQVDGANPPCAVTTVTNTSFTSRPNMRFGGQAFTDVTSSMNFVWNPGNLSGASVSATSPANNTAAPVNQVYTVVITDPSTTCTNTANVTVSVNPTPTAPTASNSTQCGFQVPTASVTTTTGAATPTFKWYDAASGGTLLQTSTSTTYTTGISATTTFYVSEVSAAGCESARSAVVVTVNAADALTAAADGPICLSADAHLSVSQTGSNQSYTYSWSASPATGSGIATTVAGASQTVTPTAAGTYVYTVTGTDASCTATSTISVTVNPNPNITSATGPAAVCSGGSVALVAASVNVTPGTATIGTGTATNGTSSNVGAAYPTYYGNGRQQYLVTAAELAAAGFGAGNITSLAFDVSAIGTGNYALNGYTLRIGATAATAITTFQSPAFTTVLGPVNYTPVVGLNTHTFTTPFSWDGTSNIIVEFCYANSVTGTSANQNVTKFSTTAFSSQVYYQIDGTVAPCAVTTVSGSSTSRPNMRFAGSLLDNHTPDFTWLWNPGSLAGASVTATAPVNTTNAAVNQVYTVTATKASTGCFSTANVTVSVNPEPPAPTVTNSTQCGSHIPTASVASTSGIATPTFKWYDAASGGNLVQSSTSNTFTSSVSSTTTYYVSEVNTATGCEGSRSAVTVNVTTPDAITATSNGPVCLGSSVTLTANQTGSNQNYTFTWSASPVSGSGIPVSTTGSPATVTPTAAGTYVYTVSAVDGGCATSATISVTVNANPSITSVTANPASVCVGGSTTLTGYSQTPGVGVAIIGTDNAASKINTVGVPYRTGSSGTVRNQYLITAAELTAAGLQNGGISTLAFVVNSGNGTMNNMIFKMGHTSATALTTTFETTPMTTVLTLASYSPVVGDNTHTLTTPFVWDGTSNLIVEVCAQVGSGAGCTMATFTTPAGTTVGTGGATDCSVATGTLFANARPVMKFGQSFINITSNYTWTWNPGNLSGSSVLATVPNTSGDVVYTATATNAVTGCFATGTVTVSVGVPIVLNVSSVPSAICVGNSATLTATVSGGGAPYTYSWKDASNVEVGTTAAVSVSPTSTATYTVTITDFCGVTASQPVTVTVNNLPVATITPGGPLSVCAVSQAFSQTNNATTPSFIWKLAGSPISGATSSSYTATAGGSYTVQVTDAATGCIGTSAAVVLTLLPTPTAITVTPATATTICLGQSQAITASASIANNSSPSVPILTENFNGAGPFNFTATNGATANALTAWTVVTSPHTYSTSLTNVTIDGTNFAIANSDAGGSSSITDARYTSNTFSTVGYTAVSVSFKHFFRALSEVFVGVEYSTNGTTWSSVTGGTYTNTSTTGGATNPPTITNATLNLPAGALNQPSVQIRFRYEASFDWYWGVDDIQILGAPQTNYAWTSAVGAGISNAAGTPGTANNSVTVTPTVAGTYTYTVTASVSGSSCTNTNTVTVNVLSPSVAPSQLNSSVVGTQCQGTNVILTQTGGSLGDGAHWQWYRDAGFSQTVGGQLLSANAQLTVSPTVTTTYYLRAEGGTSPCVSMVAAAGSVMVDVYTTFTAQISAQNAILCEPGSFTTIMVTNGPANGSVTVTANGANPQVVNLDATGSGSFGTGPLNNNTAYAISAVGNGVCSNGGGGASTTVYVGALVANPMPNSVYCNGSTVGPLVFSGNFPGGTQFTWTATNGSTGIATSGTGTQIPAFTATNTGGSAQVSEVAVEPVLSIEGCQIKPMMFQITVQPSPSVNAVSSQTICSGNATTAITFSGVSSGTTYSWTNSNPAIGLIAAGTGNIPSFSAVNNTANGTITATITVTPSNHTCSGVPTSFTITVNKSVVSLSYPGSPFCQGGYATPARVGATGGTYTAVPAGLSLSSTTGQVNLALSTPNTYTITYTVVGSAGGCGGTAQATITVLPKATVATTAGNPVYCNGVATAAISFTGTGNSYTWTNTNPAIGLGASGTGNIGSFTATNATSSTISGTITVTPTGTGGASCPGQPISFRISVYPTPTVNAIASQGPLCRGGSFVAVPLTSPVTGTTYRWTNNTPGIGLASGGVTSTVPGFVAANPTAAPLTATITVIPTANKCQGPASTYTYTVNNCVAQSGNTGGGSDMSRMASAITLSPNPTQNRVTVSYSGTDAGPYMVQLLTQFGQAVTPPASFSGNTYTLDLSGVASGIYMIRFTNPRTNVSVQKQVIKL
jgi:hypothetical protein